MDRPHPHVHYLAKHPREKRLYEIGYQQGISVGWHDGFLGATNACILLGLVGIPSVLLTRWIVNRGRRGI